MPIQADGGTLTRGWLGWGACCADCRWQTDGNDYAAQSIAARMLARHRAKSHPTPDLPTTEGGQP